MKTNNQNNSNDNKDINNYQKRGFIKNLPFGFKATFIKYWFYGALYFFCFMGLGLVLKNENLVLVTGLIGGAVFDIAVYNIFLLFAETREQAAKWWIFKSKKVYSLLINIVVITGFYFAFYYISVPIRAAIDSTRTTKTWFLAEPFTSSLVLIILDTSLCWIKNLIVMLFNKLMNKTPDKIKERENYIKIIEVTPVTVTFEINSKGNYNTLKPFNVFLDNEVVLKKVEKNVITLFDLKPDTQYNLVVNKVSIKFTTSKIFKFYKVYENNDLQDIIDNADQHSLIVVNEGNYNIKTLTLKSNIVLYLRKGVVIKVSDKEEDYPLIPSMHPFYHDEIYGNFNGEKCEMRKSIIHIDHLSNVKVIGEGIIDASNLSNINKKIIPPHIIFINHSSNITIQGLTLKNSPQTSINTFFSSEIKLENLHIENNKMHNGINIDCSSQIDLTGNEFIGCKEGISIKSGEIDIGRTYHKISKEINIKNSLFNNCIEAISFGDENSSGLSSISISNSLINNSEVGLYFKTNLERGKDAIIKDININSVSMDYVSTPIIMNMYHDDNLNKLSLNTYDMPRFIDFIFKNIIANNYELCAGYFYGLDKRYIDEIKIIDSAFTAKDNCKEGYPIENKGISKCSKNGFIIKNIRSFNLKNVKVNNIVDRKIIEDNVSEIIDN